MSGEPISDGGGEPVACRGCLASGRALRPLSGAQAAALQDLTRSTVSRPEVCPKYMCSVCCSLLRKFTVFRDRCVSVQTLCQDLYSRGLKTSTNEIESLADNFRYLQKINIQNISIEPKVKTLVTTYIQRVSIEPDEDSTVSDIVVQKSIKAEQIEIDINLKDDSIDSENDNYNDNDFTIQNESLDDSSGDLKELQKINASTIKKDLETIANFSNSSSDMLLSSSEAENDSDDSDIALNNFKKKHAKKRLKVIQKKSHKKPKLEHKPDIKSRKKTFSKPTKVEKPSNSNVKNNAKTKGSLKEIQQLIRTLKSENERCKVKNGGMVPKKPRKLGVEERKRERSESEYNMKIVQLTKEEQMKKLEARKDSLNYKRATYKCDQCFRGFIKEFTYKNHIAKHDSSQGDYPCDVCGLRFPTETSVKKHVSSFHEYDYICNECGHVSKYLYSAVVHFRWHKGVKYDCKICGKTFDKPTSVMGHMHLKHGGTTSCAICDEMFIGEKGLDRHMKMSHKEALGAICEGCNIQFHSESALRRHRPQGGSCDHTLRPCAACGEGFPTDQLLSEHKLEHHKKRGFVCETCGKQYGDARSYHGHVTYHLYNKPGTSKPFKANADQPPVTWMCEVCGRSYKSKAALNLHHLSHTGEKPFRCDFCQQGYKSKASLQAHISKHTGAPPRYSCNFCSKKFKHDSNRKRHESAVHKKLRPFKCNLCENTYQDKHTLQTHVNTKHHGLPWPKRVRKGNAGYSPPHLDFYHLPNYHAK